MAVEKWHHHHIYWACFQYSIQSANRLDFYSKAPWVKCMNMWFALFLKSVQSFNMYLCHGHLSVKVQLSCWNGTYSADFWEWEVKRAGCCHFRDFSFSFLVSLTTNHSGFAGVNTTILGVHNETSGQFSGNEKLIFLTASRDISICVCGDKTRYFKAKHYLFLS